jgi:hypothetical protein
MEIPTNENWKVVGKEPIHQDQPNVLGRLWEVKCTQYCQQTTTRHTKQINADTHKCPCRIGPKQTVLLDIHGTPQTLPDLLNLYPDVKAGVVYNRLSQRAHGKNSYTDDQVFFGVKGNPRKQESELLLVARKEASGMLTNFAVTGKRYMSAAMDEFFNKELRGWLISTRMQANRQDKAPTLAGADYVIEAVGHFEIQYLVDSGQISDIREFLSMESFKTPEEKATRLAPFIYPDLTQWQTITDQEMLQLTSVLYKNEAPV